MEYLKLSSSGKLTRAQLGEFINFCLAILETYFHFNHEPIIKFLFANGLTIKDISIECLSSFFRLNSENKPALIQNFLGKFNKPFEEHQPEIVYRRFHGYLQHSAEFYILYLEKQYDHQSYKIRRRLTDYINGSEKLIIKKEIRGKTIYAKSADPLLELPMLTNEDINLKFDKLRFIEGKKKITDYIFETLCSITSARRAVLLSSLVEIIKYCNHVDFVIEDLADPALPDISNIDTSQAMFLIDRMLTEKLLKNYINKGMSAPDAEAVKKSCFDIIADMIHSGSHDNYYLYFSRYSTISKDQFETEFRRKFDYLIKVSREILADCFADEDSENHGSR